MQARAKHLRISPKKANLVAGLVRRQKVTDALSILKFTPKKAAKLLSKVIKSAAANASHNFKQNFDELIIQEILVSKGPTLKRSLPVSRGRSHPILKRTAHIRVTVGLNPGEKKDAPAKSIAKEKDEPAKVKTISQKSKK